MLWVYCFHLSPTDLLIVDVLPFKSDSTACRNRTQQRCSSCSWTTFQGAFWKEKYEEPVWPVETPRGILLFCGGTWLMYYLEWKVCWIRYVLSYLSVNLQMLSCCRVGLWASVTSELAWRPSGNFIFRELLEIILYDSSQGIQIPQLHNYLVILKLKALYQ